MPEVESRGKSRTDFEASEEKRFLENLEEVQRLYVAGDGNNPNNRP